MVKVKKAARSGGKLRTKKHRAPAGPNPKAFARSSNGNFTLDVEIEDELFTLRDIARHTSSHHTQREESNSHLRDQAIKFVKSEDLLKGTLHEVEEDEDSGGPYAHEPWSGRITSTSEATDLVHSMERAKSPTPSDSSDEVVHFNGRNKSVRASVGRPLHGEAGAYPPESGLPSEVGSSKVAPDADSVFAPNLLSHKKALYPMKADDQGSFQQNDSAQRPGSPSSSEVRFGSRTDSRLHDSLDDSLADYMQNMWNHGQLDDDFIFQARRPPQDIDGWDVSDLANFDDLSTSDEVGQAVDLVLAKRQRQSGLQYLIVWQGQSVDEARWIHHDLLNMAGAKDFVQKFEEQYTHMTAGSNSCSNSSTNDREDEKERVWRDSVELTDSSDHYDDDESLKDEEMVMRMADEQIARLLSKQEELGMGSDDLILFDDPGHDGEATNRSEEFISFGRPPKAKENKTDRRRKVKEDDHSFRLHDSLPGDDYGGFDIMDFERHSVSKKSRANKEPMFDLSDSELEAELREQFAADRRKKKAKKKEREELRAQGLLGKKNKFRPDMAVRYNDGLSISQLKHEMEEFLFHDSVTLALPPMGKTERKIVHQIASQFNLKSKSVGSGKSRFPTLHKTARTIDFDATLFNQVEGKLHGRFLPRMDKRTKGRGHTLTRAGGGVMTTGTGYAEGETVGASAPELGSDNRGRAMLEKMGWSTGMALGALDNKGILQPITHIVKKTRAGLG